MSVGVSTLCSTCSIRQATTEKRSNFCKPWWCASIWAILCVINRADQTLLVNGDYARVRLDGAAKLPCLWADREDTGLQGRPASWRAWNGLIQWILQATGPPGSGLWLALLLKRCAISRLVARHAPGHLRWTAG